MVVTTIYVTRHGFRGNWTIDPQTGTYATTTPSPTGIPSDPPLAGYGVLQSQQLAIALAEIKDPPITCVYSSPFYRCLQTIQPFVERSGIKEIRGDNGLGEWYGLARWDHPSPAPPSRLHELFPAYSLSYKPSIIPSKSGESISDLHRRIAYALHYIIQHADAEDKMSASHFPEMMKGCDGNGTGQSRTTILLCTHAASMIAIGRVLTGIMPEDLGEDDFQTYTCGISKFERMVLKIPEGEEGAVGRSGTLVGGKDLEIPDVNWGNGRGVLGGWDCVMNGDCSHLDGGEERGWHFQGDEAFHSGEFIDKEGSEPQGDDSNEQKQTPKL